MLVLPIHLTLLGKSKGGLVATPRADILETVQDLLVLTVLLGEEKDRERGKGKGNEGATTCESFSLLHLLPRILFLCRGVLHLLCPSLDLVFSLS